MFLSAALNLAVVLHNLFGFCTRQLAKVACAGYGTIKRVYVEHLPPFGLSEPVIIFY
jgi:hypothetical protein